MLIKSDRRFRQNYKKGYIYKLFQFLSTNLNFFLEEKFCNNKFVKQISLYIRKYIIKKLEEDEVLLFKWILKENQSLESVYCLALLVEVIACIIRANAITSTITQVSSEDRTLSINLLYNILRWAFAEMILSSISSLMMNFACGKIIYNTKLLLKLLFSQNSNFFKTKSPSDVFSSWNVVVESVNSNISQPISTIEDLVHIVFEKIVFLWHFFSVLITPNNISEKIYFAIFMFIILLFGFWILWNYRIAQSTALEQRAYKFKIDSLKISDILNNIEVSQNLCDIHKKEKWITNLFDNQIQYKEAVDNTCMSQKFLFSLSSIVLVFSGVIGILLYYVSDYKNSTILNICLNYPSNFFDDIAKNKTCLSMCMDLFQFFDICSSLVTCIEDLYNFQQELILIRSHTALLSIESLMFSDKFRHNPDLLKNVNKFDTRKQFLRFCPGDKCLFEHNLDPLKSFIELQDISYKPGPLSGYILHKTNLRFESGSSTALLGVSGSGKSTLLKLISGTYEISSGDIIVNDIYSIKDLNHCCWAKLIGYNSQESKLLNTTVLKNILATYEDSDIYLGSDSKEVNYLIEEACKLAALDNVVDKLDKSLQFRVGVGGNYLSGGERQRLALARFFLSMKLSNRIALLEDEATAALDSKTEELISKSISLFKQLKIIVAHRPTRIKGYVNNVITLAHGYVERIYEENELDWSKLETYFIGN